jgi:phosphate starvation-inducible PhoH-like protein
MTKKNKNKSQSDSRQKAQYKQDSTFHLEFLNLEQKNAYEVFMKNEIVFLIGEAGSGKTFLATAFALSSLLSKKTRKIIISRPIVEAGEKLGFLPGTFDEKVLPYMLPIYDTLDDLVGKEGLQREYVNKCLEVAPIAYLRGRTFKNSIAILDEAQNATKTQLKLFLTRIGMGSKLLVTGDPKQSDIGQASGLMEVVEKLKGIKGIGIIEFSSDAIVRHPIISSIIKKI